MSGKYRKLLLFWGILFALSAFLIVFNLGRLQQQEGGEGGPGTGFPETPEEGGDGSGALPPGPEEGEPPLNMILAIITAVASGGGFIVTTLFALREDRRESALYDLEVENLKKEIEQKELEIAKLRREQQEKGGG